MFVASGSRKVMLLGGQDAAQVNTQKPVASGATKQDCPSGQLEFPHVICLRTTLLHRPERAGQEEGGLAAVPLTASLDGFRSGRYAPSMKVVGVGVVGLALFGVACGGSSLAPVDGVTSLHVTKSDGIAGNPPPPKLDLSVTDEAKARDVYAATLALPPPPSGRTNCPSDVGVSDTFDFLSGSRVVTTAVVDVSGCRFVTISGMSARWAIDQDYWTTLAADLGVDVTTLQSTGF
jgi:hypothetical protein